MTKQDLINQITVGAGRRVAAPVWLGILESTFALIAGNPRVKTYRPEKSTLKYYEGRQKGDIQSLYSGRPYDSPELGYSPQEMESSFGARGGEFEAARQGEEQTISDAYARLGGRHLQGTEFRAKQRARESDLARRGGNRRAVILADAAQKRADWARRFGMLSGAYQFGTGLLNQDAMARYQAARMNQKLYGQAGGEVAGLIAAGAAGGMAGGGGAGAGILSAMQSGGSGGSDWFY